MFTPPPSPQPPKTFKSQEVTSPHTSSHSVVDEPSQPTYAMSSHELKQRTGRRLRWAVLIVPLVLVLITASTRYLTHPAAFDILSETSSTDWSRLTAQVKSWRPHRRHPQTSNFPLPSPTPSSPFLSPVTAQDPAPQPIPTIPSTPPTLPTPFPQFYDEQLPHNFSSASCSQFFSNMTQSAAFRQCRPFSLLSGASNDFMTAQANLTLMNTLIWGTCNTNPGVNQCIANIGWFASALGTACEAEFEERNTLVTDTSTGLRAYKLMYDTACREDPTTNTYCYIDAIASPNHADLYLYQLPLGIALPRTVSDMACSPCAKTILDIYAEALSNSTVAAELAGLKSTYDGAAKIATQSCGEDYARTGIASSSVSSREHARFAWLAAVFMLTSAFLV